MLDDLIIRRCICIFYKDPWNLAYTKLVGAYGTHLATEAIPFCVVIAVTLPQSKELWAGGSATFPAEPFSIWYTPYPWRKRDARPLHGVMEGSSVNNNCYYEVRGEVRWWNSVTAIIYTI